MTKSDSNFLATLVAAALVLATVTLMSVAFTTARAAGSAEVSVCTMLDCPGARMAWGVKRHDVADLSAESLGKTSSSALSY